jgi:uncharacterized protein YbaP (TraB family)
MARAAVWARWLVLGLAAVAPRLFAADEARVAQAAAPLPPAAASTVRAPKIAPAAPPAASAPAAGDCPAGPVALTAEDVATGMRDAVDSGFLWRATRDGRAVYLYGTIHIARREWMFPGPHVLAALRESSDVALELDPTDPQIIARLQRALARGPGTPELPSSLAARLMAQAAEACVAPAELADMRPEMQAVTLEVMSGRRLGLQPAYGIDVFVAQLARELRKTLHSIETPEAQAALLVSDDPRKTARNVGEILDELESGNGPKLLGRLAGDWRHGDLEDMSAYRDWCQCLETPEERADFVKLIDERNPVMARRIAEWHAQGRTLFVAVGSLHLVGLNGLPALLRARGFTVERVDYEH